MASAVTTNKFKSRNKMVVYDHDPDTTNPLITSPDGGTTKRYLPMAGYELFVAQVMATIATGGPTLVEIVAATDAAGTNETQIVSSGTVAADAVGDGVHIECTAEQVREVGAAAGYNFTHVGVRITCANSGDECAVVYLLGGALFEKDGLSANYIS